ncbi:MAG: LacI family transcriptional regulator, partial [Candidatus Pacebacteria bacterium]|nr:LacI family transcriptional regulator [Candidatus Paceibacterota bacterium]
MAKIRKQQVTLRDIADACGLSPISISYALRGDRKNVSAATIEKVRRKADAMGYDRHLAHAARRLRYQQDPDAVVNHLAALFFPFYAMDDVYWGTVFRGLQSVMFPREFGLLSCGIDALEQDPGQRLLPIFRRGDIDGAIIFATRPALGTSLVHSLRGEGGFGTRPIVVALMDVPGCSSVVVDDYEVGHAAAAHLLGLGHKHLLTFTNPGAESPMTKNRIAGHRAAVQDACLPPENFVVGHWIWEDDRGLDTALADMLERYPEVTGILAPNDDGASSLYHALHRLGYSVPRDFSVIGVDDCPPLLNLKGENILSTISLPIEDMGVLAGELLLEHIEDPGKVCETKVLSGELIARSTTAPPRA